MSFGVAIIGAGRIGMKRAISVSKDKNSQLLTIVDIDIKKARSLARDFGGNAQASWCEVVKNQDIDIVIVSTVNKFLAPISIAALKNKKHVLCEKPLGRNSAESKKIMEAVWKNRVILKTGFNHRYRPAITRAKQLLDSGKIGKLHFMRCRYGHGGRPGYEKEWRANRDLCGGGELLDQGVHVVDLFNWFGGPFDQVFGCISTYFWNMQVEDNAFAIFKNRKGIIASMHTSWTQWKNLFSLEIFCSKGYLIIEGLGGSYGKETLRIGKRKPQSGPPQEKILEFSGPDISWDKEWEDFIYAVQNKREPLGSARDGYIANRMIEAVYESAKNKKIAKISY